MITICLLLFAAILCYIIMWKTSTASCTFTFMEAMMGTGFAYIPATDNWTGVPPPGLTWDEVSKVTLQFITPMTHEVAYTHCPKCGRELIEYLSDYWCFTDADCRAIGVPLSSGQYDVQGNYCPKGHYTHLGWA